MNAFRSLILCTAVATASNAQDCEVACETNKLLSSVASVDDVFAFSVSVSGNTAVAGAHGDDHSNRTNPGRVLLYRREGSQWGAPVAAYDPSPGLHDNLGVAVAASGD